MRREHRDQIKTIAEREFAHHKLIVKGISQGDPTSDMMEHKPYVWLCRSTEPQLGYWFFVAELPWAIVQYGDVGGLMISQGSAYDLRWLEGSIESMDYVLEKSDKKKDYLVPELFEARVREHGHDPDNYQGFADYVLQTGDTDAYESCHDWAIGTLWGYWALRKFVELRKALRAQ